MAQPVEQLTRNEQVVRSNRISSSKELTILRSKNVRFVSSLFLNFSHLKNHNLLHKTTPFVAPRNKAVHSFVFYTVQDSKALPYRNTPYSSAFSCALLFAPAQAFGGHCVQLLRYQKFISCFVGMSLHFSEWQFFYLPVDLYPITPTNFSFNSSLFTRLSAAYPAAFCLRSSQ